MILDIPAGRFLVFGRHQDGYVSFNRDLRYSPEPSSPDCYQKLKIPVVPSAVLELSEVSVSADSYVGAWILDTEKSLGTFIPSISGEATLFVPAGIPIIPLEINQNNPRRVGPVLTLKPRERYRLASAFSDKSDRGDVIVWLKGDDSLVRRLTKEKHVLDDPQIRLTAASGGTFILVADPRHPGSYTGSLVFFKDVPIGKATISFTGRLWSPASIEVDVSGTRVGVPKNPLLAMPASAIRVALPVALAGLTAGSCEKPTSNEVHLKLRRCAAQRGDVNCETADEITADANSAVVEFRGVTAGNYIVEVIFPNGRSVINELQAHTGQETEVSAELVGTILYGTVREGKSPIHAELTFPTSDRVTSDASGAFRALLKTEPGPHPIAVTACDGRRFMYLPERAPNTYQPLDMVIPQNSLTVLIRDARTGAALRGSQAKYGVLRDRENDNDSFSAWYTQSSIADEEGRATFHGIAPKKPVRVCASARDYKPKCATTTISVPENGERSVEISLAPESMRVGYVVTPEPEQNAVVFLLDFNGRVVAQSTVHGDGSFFYESIPSRGYAVVISPTLPLSLIPFGPLTDDAKLILRVDKTRTRRIRVEVSPHDPPRTARVAIKIAGVQIPEAVFLQFQNTRGLQTLIINGRPLDILDVADAVPLQVVLGPDPRDASLPPDAIDRPEYAVTFPSHIVRPGEQVVRFD